MIFKFSPVSKVFQVLYKRVDLNYFRVYIICKLYFNKLWVFCLCLLALFSFAFRIVLDISELSEGILIALNLFIYLFIYLSIYF